MRVFLILLLLALPGLAEPRLYPTSEERLGSVVLLTDQEGEQEAETLQSLGLDTALAHTAQDVQLALPKLKNPVLVSLGQTAPLALQARGVEGVVLIDPTLPEAPTFSVPTLLLAPQSRLDAFKSLAAPNLEIKAVPHGAEGLTEENDAVQKSVRRFAQAFAKLTPRGLPGVPFVYSPNWDVRSAHLPIDTVVVHSTVINTMEGTQRAFLDDKVRRVSAHYVIDRDGTIVQMVDERCTAWHAGVSELEGRTGVNDFSVGVELINLNDGKDPYPDAQVEALARVIRDLRTRFTIPNERIVSHALIARPVGRKSDPVGFDFQKLYNLLK